MYWLRYWSQLEKNNQDKEIIHFTCLKLETVAMQIFVDMNGDLATGFAFKYIAIQTVGRLCLLSRRKSANSCNKLWLLKERFSII
jgi:hypothetical protein